MLYALNYYAVFLYGLLIMVFLLDIKPSRKSVLAIAAYATASGLLILALYLKFGASFVQKSYPLAVHVPLVLFLCVFFKKRFPSVLFVLCVAYVLTSPRKWLGDLAALPFGGNPQVAAAVEIIVSVPLLMLVYRYLRPAVIKILEDSGMKILLLTVIPFIYYVVAYATTVYSDLLYHSNIVVVGFLATGITYVFYAFLVTYFNELSKTFALRNEQTMYKMQAQAAASQLEQIRESQAKTAIYRHDFRHHLSYIDGCILGGRADEARAYIASISSNMEQTAVKRYCENETVNLILSYYVSKAEDKGISVIHDIAVPGSVGIDPSDICVVLANGMENAIHAAEVMPDAALRQIEISCHMKNGKLFIEIVNPYAGTVVFDHDIPQNDEENHGIGAKSIIAACEKHRGVYSFHAENHMFTLRVVM